jgi:macrolide-specific efflux system membrane fusion protein
MRRSRRILAINGVLVLALAGAAWGAYELLWPSPESNAASGGRTATVNRADVIETVSAAGAVQSAYTAEVNFGTAGTVSEVDVKVGDVVTVGQVLGRLDAAEADQQVKVAQSNVNAASEDLATAQDAEDAGTATTTGGQAPQAQQQQSITSLQAKLEQAKLALQQAKDAQAATVLKSPGAGTVTALTGAVGQRVGSSTGASASSSSSASSASSSAFLTLTDMTNLVVKANVAEIDVSKLKAGQDATVTINALPDTPVPAKVNSVDLTPTSSNNIVQFGAYLGLVQPPAGLRPGQSASVAITVARADGALSVPSAAVRTVGEVNTVTVVENGQQVNRPIEVGVRSESLVQVTSGLSEGEQVVLSTTATTGVSGGGAGGGRFGGGGGGGFGGGALPGGGGAAIPGTGR